MRPSSLGAPDKVIWVPTKTGDYSTKSGYYAAVELDRPRNLTNPAQNFNWIKNIWSLKTAPKIQVFLWKVMQGSLPLEAALYRQGIVANSVSCPRCGEEETAAHLFLHCSFTKRAWELLPLKCSIDPSDFDSLSMALARTTGLVCLPPTGNIIELFPWLCWCLWTARNSLVFENFDLSPRDIVVKTIRLAKEWQEAQLTDLKHNSSLPSTGSNINSPLETITCHTDASWLAQTKVAGCGWCFTDSTGKRLRQGTLTETHIASPLMAEAVAVREAILHAKSLHYSKICLKSSNQVLINALISKTHPVEIYELNMDIENLSPTFLFLHFSFIPRIMNSAADSIAKSAVFNCYSVQPA